MIKAFIYYPILLLYAVAAMAQPQKFIPPDSSKVSVNQSDKNGQPYGMWIVKVPPLRGEPGYTEFGKFAMGEKTGVWYKLGDNGELMASETYRRNVLDGEAKYFYEGRLLRTGYYRGLNPEREYDTLIIEDPVTGLQYLKSVHNDRYTVRHGHWKYYDYETGRLIREEEYQVDSVIYAKDFPLNPVDSAYYKKREAKMPHKKKKIPPNPAAGHLEYIR